MFTADSVTQWRDTAITPTGYDDLPALVKLARAARNAVVTFDWAFSEAGLRGLREAVHEWGSPVSGRYRVFDSRVLAAINVALDEPHSDHVLSEPRNVAIVAADVSCTRDGDGFHLRGEATFDLVFSYATCGVNPRVIGAAHLGEAAAVLAEAGAALGWDVPRLQDPSFRPVRNAIYGLPLDYGITPGQPSSAPVLEVAVAFAGPFSACAESECPCLFNDPMSAKRGVYLWTFVVNGRERPWYVGKTNRSFGQRFAEHVRGFLSGQYTTFDAEALSRGEYRRVSDVEGFWPQNLPSIIANFERVGPDALKLVRQMRVHVAELEPLLQERVEGALGRHFKREHPEFMMPGLVVPVLVPYDRPLHMTISTAVPLEGLPAELRE